MKRRRKRKKKRKRVFGFDSDGINPFEINIPPLLVYLIVPPPVLAPTLALTPTPNSELVDFLS